ncbi:MAG: SRPBCC family protein [Verrucomicrobiales bacterium]|nr:SRPBCC family protein [Verrucomicrobiales bacterium]
MPKLQVTKSIVLQVPPTTAFATVRDLSSWPAWSPWLITDPECAFEVAEDGRSYRWNGPVCGAGVMRVTAETEARRIDFDLLFLKPWKSAAQVAMKFEEVGDGTRVTWSMDSSLPFFLFFLQAPMVTLIGMDYERGLKMLKDRLERGSVPSQLEFPGVQDFAGGTYFGIRSTCALADLGPKMQADFDRLHQWLEGTEAVPAGPPISMYHRWDLKRRVTEYTTAFPLEKKPGTLPPGFVQLEVPACRTFAIEHIGAYRHLGNAWSAGMMRARSKVFRQSKTIHPFECYLTKPGTAEEAEIRSVVHFPLRD